MVRVQCRSVDKDGQHRQALSADSDPICTSRPSSNTPGLHLPRIASLAAKASTTSAEDPMLRSPRQSQGFPAIDRLGGSCQGGAVGGGGGGAEEGGGGGGGNQQGAALKGRRGPSPTTGGGDSSVVRAPDS